MLDIVGHTRFGVGLDEAPAEAGSALDDVLAVCSQMAPIGAALGQQVSDDQSERASPPWVTSTPSSAP